MEAANAFLMSSFAVPMIAPKMSVTVPTTTTAVCATGAPSKIGPDRTTRYTPAVTIVAAWMRADTGVGPSIASSSHDCSGTWADLPHAASRRSSPIAVNQPVEMRSAEPVTARISLVPTAAKEAMMARDMPRSPTRFTTKAFFAAVAADGLCCQKPMSR